MADFFTCARTERLELISPTRKERLGQALEATEGMLDAWIKGRVYPVDDVDEVVHRFFHETVRNVHVSKEAEQQLKRTLYAFFVPAVEAQRAVRRVTPVRRPVAAAVAAAAAAGEPALAAAVRVGARAGAAGANVRQRRAHAAAADISEEEQEEEQEQEEEDEEEQKEEEEEEEEEIVAVTHERPRQRPAVVGRVGLLRPNNVDAELEENVRTSVRTSVPASHARWRDEQAPPAPAPAKMAGELRRPAHKARKEEEEVDTTEQGTSMQVIGGVLLLVLLLAGLYTLGFKAFLPTSSFTSMDWSEMRSQWEEVSKTQVAAKHILDADMFSWKRAKRSPVVAVVGVDKELRNAAMGAIVNGVSSEKLLVLNLEYVDGVTTVTHAVKEQLIAHPDSTIVLRNVQSMPDVFIPFHQCWDSTHPMLETASCSQALFVLDVAVPESTKAAYMHLGKTSCAFGSGSDVDAALHEKCRSDVRTSVLLPLIKHGAPEAVRNSGGFDPVANLRRIPYAIPLF